MITSINGWKDMIPEDILVAMKFNVGIPNPTPVTMAMIKDSLTSQQYGEFRLSLIVAKSLINSDIPEHKILAEDIYDTQTALAGNGFLFHTPDRQALLDTMGLTLGWSNSLTNAIKEISVKQIPYWKTIGLNIEPTLEDIEKEKIIEMCRDEIDSQLNKLRSKSTSINGWLDNLDRSQYTTSEIQQYCVSLLDSDDGNPNTESK